MNSNSKIALYDTDKTNFPNLALMKISSHHKSLGDKVYWWNDYIGPNEDIETLYVSKVFTFSEDRQSFEYMGSKPKNIIYGGTGYDIKKQLPEEIEHILPDYSLYNLDYSLGFLTRGCPNKCSFCIVPEKEGGIKPHADIDEFLKHDKAVLMDNNIIASDHGIRQLEKIAQLGIKIDINQGLDARLIDDGVARLLSKIKWLKPVRLACDQQSQMGHIQKAVTLLRWHNVTPRRYFVYCLIDEIDESLSRIKFLKGLDVDVFGQPLRDFRKNIDPTIDQRRLARWVNHKAIFKKTTFDEYLEQFGGSAG